MKAFLKNFVADQSGASAAEYALILAVVVAGIALAAGTLAGNIETKITEAADTVAG